MMNEMVVFEDGSVIWKATSQKLNIVTFIIDPPILNQDFLYNKDEDNVEQEIWNKVQEAHVPPLEYWIIHSGLLH